jgi:pimeloyl-ACP methyl ester carboxylesterase
MMRNVRTKVKKPVMLLLHGSGSSSDIFGIQTHTLARSLSATYDLVKIDAPITSAPGPGVLPFFADMPNYYRWLAPNLSPSLRATELLGVAKYISSELDDQNVKADDIVAFLGFSQGAMVSLAMLSLRLLGLPYFPNLRFVVSIGANTSGNTEQLDKVEQMMASLSSALGREDSKFPGYTVQASGLKDIWYDEGKRLQSMCAKEKTEAMDYRDGHVVPRSKIDVVKLANLIARVDDASKAESYREVRDEEELLALLNRRE